MRRYLAATEQRREPAEAGRRERLIAPAAARGRRCRGGGGTRRGWRGGGTGTTPGTGAALRYGWRRGICDDGYLSSVPHTHTYTHTTTTTTTNADIMCNCCRLHRAVLAPLVTARRSVTGDERGGGKAAED
jgi:hypothetical protein